MTVSSDRLLRRTLWGNAAFSVLSGAVLAAFAGPFADIATHGPVEVLGLDLAVVLPALFPGTPNDTLDDWTRQFGLPPIGRHHAIADAYANAQLLLLALEQSQRLGLQTAGDLLDLEQSQRWLGRRR